MRLINLFQGIHVVMNRVTVGTASFDLKAVALACCSMYSTDILELHISNMILFGTIPVASAMQRLKCSEDFHTM